jgi:mono/diheme cytochrome c family protein
MNHSIPRTSPFLLPPLLLASHLAGCATSDADGDDDSVARVSYAADVEPILARHCVTCHVEGAIAPFALDSLDAARQWGAASAVAARMRVMPPWNPDNSGDCQTYSNARWLTEAEISVLERWVEDGMPAGEAVPPSMPPAEPPVAVTVVRGMPEPYRPEASAEHPSDDYRCLVIPGFDADTHVTAYEVRPGRLDQVHHIIGYVAANAAGEEEILRRDAEAPGPGFPCFSGLNDANVLGVFGWAPGTMSARYPDGVGIEVPGGRPMVLEIHYNLANGVEPDRTDVAFELAAEVERAGLLLAYDDAALLLQPGRPDATHGHAFRFADFGVPEPLLVYGVSPHMHLRGVSQRLEALREDGSTTCLMDVPRWDFHWQDLGIYSAPVRIEPEDLLRTTCVFDTRNDAAPVAWGEGTTDEMCLSTLVVTRENGRSFSEWE